MARCLFEEWHNSLHGCRGLVSSFMKFLNNCVGRLCPGFVMNEMFAHFTSKMIHISGLETRGPLRNLSNFWAQQPQ